MNTIETIRQFKTWCVQLIEQGPSPVVAQCRTQEESAALADMLNLLLPATKDRVAGKYARNAIDNLCHGFTMLAREECLSGHFVMGHDGDKSFLPVRRQLDDLLAKPTLIKNAPQVWGKFPLIR